MAAWSELRVGLANAAFAVKRSHFLKDLAGSTLRPHPCSKKWREWKKIAIALTSLKVHC